MVKLKDLIFKDIGFPLVSQQLPLGSTQPSSHWEEHPGVTEDEVETTALCHVALIAIDFGVAQRVFLIFTSNKPFPNPP